MPTRAFEVLDCASKVRIHYLVEAPLSGQLFQLFPDAEVTVEEFSRRVAGAKDHFTIVGGGRFRAAGVMGGDRLVVTYAKAGAARPEDAIAAFEARLCAAGMGPILAARPLSE